MRLFLFILSILFSGLSFAQKNDTLVKYLDKNFTFTNRSGMTYSAIAYPQNDHWIVKSFYDDKSILIEASFIDKKLTIKDGPLTAYYPKGLLALQGSFQNGQRNGLWRSWHKNGQIKDSGTIKNDQLTGSWITWYENGKMTTRAHFSDEKSLYSSMRPIASETSSLLLFPEPASSKNGTWETWSVNGQQKDSGNYENDFKTGLWKSWYANGKPESQGSYGAKESLQGDWIFYREDGTVSTKEKYLDGKLADLSCFDEKGNLTGSFCSIAKPPVLLGTPYDWKVFFETHIEWSKETIKRGREGTTTVRFFISKDGKLSDHKLINVQDELVAKDIEQVISLMTDWSPAILHNRPFEFSFDYAVPFYR